MNGILASRRFLLRGTIGLLVLAGLALTRRSDAGPPDKVLDARARPVPFQILQKFQDGPWLVPTLRSFRSESDWNMAMEQWLAREEVAGRQAPPKVDWTHQAVVVLALGTQPRRTGVSVHECRVEGELTILDLHFDTGGDQWDPFYVAEHPAVVVALERSDLKNLKLICDAVVDGLPGAAGRPLPHLNRPGSPRGTAAVASTGPQAMDAAPISAAESVQLLDGGAASTTWGRVKASYRGSSPSH